jgi:hypothetical protein
MITISNGVENTPLHEGMVFGEWVLVAVVCNDRHATIATHTFRFFTTSNDDYVRSEENPFLNGDILSITNAEWPGAKSSCFNATTGEIHKCPDVLLPFSYRTTRVIPDRRATQAED